MSVCTYLLPGANALKLEDEKLCISHCDELHEQENGALTQAACTQELSQSADNPPDQEEPRDDQDTCTSE